MFAVSHLRNFGFSFTLNSAILDVFLSCFKVLDEEHIQLHSLLLGDALYVPYNVETAISSGLLVS